MARISVGVSFHYRFVYSHIPLTAAFVACLPHEYSVIV